MMLMAPAGDVAPCRVPWGPRRISTRSRSYSWVKALSARTMPEFQYTSTALAAPASGSMLMPRMEMFELRALGADSVTPAVCCSRSMKLRAENRSMESPVTTFTVADMSCTSSVRFCAVTMISSSCSCASEGMVVSATAAAIRVFCAFRPWVNPFVTVILLLTLSLWVDRYAGCAAQERR